MEEIVRFEIYRKLKGIRKYFENILSKPFPSQGSIKLSSFILNVCDLVLDNFDAFSSRQVGFIHNLLLKRLQEFCGYIHDAETKNVPWSLIPSFTNLFKKIEGENSSFIICPIWETNYSIYPTSGTQILQQIIKTIFQDQHDNEALNNLLESNEQVFFIFFPRIEKLSVLHFPLLGHELGHIYALDWCNKHREAFFKKYDIQRNVEHACRQHIKENQIKSDSQDEDQSDDLFLDAYVTSRSSKVIENHVAFIMEILADVFDTLLFGPSTLLSCYFFAITANLDSIGTHPPWRCRLYFILETLKIVDFTTFDDEEADKHIAEITQRIKDYSADRYTGDHCSYLNLLLESIESELANLVKDIQAYLDGQTYKFSEFKQKRGELIQRLELGIPPNELLNSDNLMGTNGSISLQDIIHTTWLFIINKYNTDSDLYYNICKMANLLSLKAIEFVEIHEKYRIGT